MKINFEHTYFQLGEPFYHSVGPTAAVEPSLIIYNQELADQLKIISHENEIDLLAKTFSGAELLPNSKPLAMAYAGHQFGHTVPQLGDGRAILLGEVRADHKLYDIQLKGAGRTPFSRRGDGRSILGPAVREYLVSEAMFNLGIPTTRALAICLTGEQVIRDGSFPGAVFTRVAESHLRVGTFEFHYYRRDTESLRKLADYIIDRLYPELKNEEDAYFKLFQGIARKKLNLVAQWLGVGFIHGVMNTDNTSLSGETIDYGPCAFMDQFRFNKVYSSIDHQGRYRYENQSNIALWNLSVLANCFLPLLERSEDELKDLFKVEFENLEQYYQDQWLKVFANKFAISDPEENDRMLFIGFLKYLEENNLDFTNSFRNLFELLEGNSDHRLTELKQRIQSQGLSDEEIQNLILAANPFLIPRNHQVEKAIQLANSGDYKYLRRLNKAYSDPFTSCQENFDLTRPPLPEEIVHQTFCGT